MTFTRYLPRGVLIFLMLLMGSSTLAAEGDLLWQRTYQNPDCEFNRFCSVVEAENGDLLVIGIVHLGNGIDRDIWLMRTDADGNEIWSRTYGGHHLDQGFSIIPTSDGHYLIGGSVTPVSSEYMDFLLLKIDSDGRIIWQTNYGTELHDYALDVIETDDGGFLLTGMGAAPAEWGGNVLTMKTDAEGSLLWSRLYEIGNPISCATSALETSEGNFLITGFVVLDYYCEQPLIMMADSSGDTLWTSLFDELYAYGELLAVLEPTEDEFITAGYRYEPSDVILLNFDDTGAVNWNQEYSTDDPEQTSSFIMTADRNYLVLSSNLADGDLYVLKTDDHGNLLWENMIGDADEGELGSSLIQTCDGGYVIVGLQGYDGYIAKLEGPPTGVENPAFSQPSDHALVSVYPNPFNPTTEIGFDLPISSEVTLDIFDIYGRNVSSSQPQVPSPCFPPGRHSITFDGSDLPSGMYFYRLAIGEHTNTGKMVLMK